MEYQCGQKRKAHKGGKDVGGDNMLHGLVGYTVLDAQNPALLQVSAGTCKLYHEIRTSYQATQLP